MEIPVKREARLVEQAAGRIVDRVTRAHLQDVMVRIDDILEGNGG